MPINGLYEASNLSIQKALVNFAITNEVLQKLNQRDKPIFTPCDKGINIRNAVWDKNIQSLVPCFPNIRVRYDVLCELRGIAAVPC